MYYYLLHFLKSRLHDVLHGHDQLPRWVLQEQPWGHRVCRIEVQSCQWLWWVARARDQNPDPMYCLWERC